MRTPTTIQHPLGVIYFNEPDKVYRFKPTACVDLTQKDLVEIAKQLAELNKTFVSGITYFKTGFN